MLEGFLCYNQHMSRNIRYFFSFILVITILLGTFANTIQKAQASQALDNAQADKALLESELSTLEQEIAQKQKELTNQKGQSVSISRDIAILTTQIKKSKLDIQAKNLMITKLGGEIIQKNKAIVSLNLKIDSENESLSQLLRKEREIDDKSLISLILSESFSAND